MTGYFSYLKAFQDFLPYFIPYGGRLFSAAKNIEPEYAISAAVRQTRLPKMVLSLDKQFAVSGLNSFFSPSKMSSNGTGTRAQLLLGFQGQ